jgi:WD40 repeat protein
VDLSRVCEYEGTIEFLPNGRFLGLKSNESFELWDLQTGLRDDRFTGRWLVVLQREKNPAPGYVPTTGELSVYFKPSTVISRVAFSPDSHFLAAAGGKQIFLWDLNTNSSTCTLTSYSSISCVVFSFDVRLLACGSRDGTVSIWNLDRAALCKTLTKNGSSVDCVAFSPDGRLLASGNVAGTRLYDVAGIAVSGFRGGLRGPTLDAGHARAGCIAATSHE